MKINCLYFGTTPFDLLQTSYWKLLENTCKKSWLTLMAVKAKPPSHLKKLLQYIFFVYVLSDSWKDWASPRTARKRKTMRIWTFLSDAVSRSPLNEKIIGKGTRNTKCDAKYDLPVNMIDQSNIGGTWRASWEAWDPTSCQNHVCQPRLGYHKHYPSPCAVSAGWLLTDRTTQWGWVRIFSTYVRKLA